MTVVTPVRTGIQSPYDDALPVDARDGYIIRRFQGYHNIAVGSERPKDTEYKGEGDTIYVHEVFGPDKIAIATQSKGRRYPFIPVEEGYRINRPFDRFWVRMLSTRHPVLSTEESITEAMLIVSFGQAVIPPPNKPKGLYAGLASAQGTATTAGVDLFQTAFQRAGNPWTFGAANPIRPAFLKYGGTLRIRNLAAAGGAILYVYYGGPGRFAPGAPVGGIFTEQSSLPIPGATEIVLDVEGMLSLSRHPSQTIAPSAGNATLCIACSAATAEYVVSVNRLTIDGSDIESGTDPDTMTEL